MPEREREKRVAELDGLLRTMDESARRNRRAQTIATIGLATVFVVAIGALVLKGRSMYTAEKFQAELPGQLEQLRPRLESTAKDVVSRTAPHYARLAQERLEAAMPALGASVQAELDGLSAGLARRTERRIADALVAVEQKQIDRLRGLYPDLDEAELRRLRNKWAREIQTDTEDVLADFHERAMTDFTNLGRTIESYGPNRFDDMPREELVRYYAHLWLSRVDDAILADVVKGENDG